ncbi:hypothetical protein [Celeribacter halophilus]|uniref:hypothetical protein n=1 Tax=Celeribacter halophilus TaxID=576117 RepID=UPI001C07F90B|nr:hypothetical protein [Celeribacter halophilus]MBU2888849.1 hypothetical protein [Celeribacter halophilus]MDO6511460.1 hypothetical protein [Celeribacter halophilus]
MAIKVTVISSDEPRRLTKRITLQNEELMTESGGHMLRGTYAVRAFETLAEFSEMLGALRTNEAMVYGVPTGPAVGVVVTKSNLAAMPKEKREGHIARSNDHFDWSDGPGIFMIDIDPPKDGPALSKESEVPLIC